MRAASLKEYAEKDDNGKPVLDENGKPKYNDSFFYQDVQRTLSPEQSGVPSFTQIVKGIGGLFTGEFEDRLSPSEVAQYKENVSKLSPLERIVESVFLATTTKEHAKEISDRVNKKDKGLEI